MRETHPLRPLAILFFGVSAGLAACATILDLQPPPEGGTPDSSYEGFAYDVIPLACAPLDAAITGSDASYHRFMQYTEDDAGTFALMAFDLSTLSAKASGFIGGAFDGRYIYFVPASSTVVVQYDTTAAAGFGKGSSWSTFTLTTNLGIPSSTRFSGAVFDERYVYLVPHDTSSSLVVRYDTTGAFNATTSWGTFDTRLIPVPDGGVPARGFAGGGFDGHYVYFVPENSGTNDGRIARFDTKDASVGDAADAGDSGEAGGPVSPFDVVAHWSTYDIASGGNASAVGFIGAAFDGRYLYLSPHFNGDLTTQGYSGFVARYDTTATFNASGSWETSFGVDAVNAAATGFQGAAFDGRYVYFVPNHGTVAARYDTHGVIGSFSSWSTFDLYSITQAADGGPPAFYGAAFDGRFVYFVPTGANAHTGVRYDTASPFAAPCAWTTADLSEANAVAGNFAGAIYDGRYLYFVPSTSIVVRFDTKTPASMPSLPAFNGSFY